MQLLTLTRVIIHQIYTLLGSTTQIYIRGLLDLTLNVHTAATEAIRRATQGQAPALRLAVFYSFSYDQISYQLTPKQNLGQWKPIILPHLCQNSR